MCFVLSYYFKFTNISISIHYVNLIYRSPHIKIISIFAPLFFSHYLFFSLFFFFFSSRRRHTRYWRDWSSDVCSSDLCSKSRPGWVVLRSTSTLPILVWTLSILPTYYVWHLRTVGRPWLVPDWIVILEYGSVAVAAAMIALRRTTRSAALQCSADPVE